VLNIAGIIFLIFICLVSPRGFCVAAATELTSPEQLALDCYKVHALLCQHLLISSNLLNRKWQERVLGNVKFSDYPGDLADGQPLNWLEF
jgi:hypothetical protein